MVLLHLLNKKKKKIINVSMLYPNPKIAVTFLILIDKQIKPFPNHIQYYFYMNKIISYLSYQNH
jgi:hypothetical protein